MQKFNFMQKGTWSQFIAKLNGMFNQKADKTEIPPTLPNPHSLNLVGVNETVVYDGSAEKSINLSDLATTEVIYSLEERRIGYWIDGKPLYEKTIHYGALPNKTDEEKPHGIPNVDIIFVYGGFVVQSNIFIQPVWANTSTSANYSFNLYVTKENIGARSLADRHADFATLVLRYTKTTD